MNTTQVLNDPLLPPDWRRQIKFGTEAGRRAAAAWAKVMANRPVVGKVTYVSDVGDRIERLIKAELLTDSLPCGACRQYLMSLNTTHEHDHNAIVAHLSAKFPWPAEWKARNTRRREAISRLISAVVPSNASADGIA